MSSLNFNLKTPQDLQVFLNAQRQEEYKQRVILYVHALETLLAFPFVKGVSLKKPMFLFQDNSGGMEISHEFYITFADMPLELSELKDKLNEKWPAPPRVDIDKQDYNYYQKMKQLFIDEETAYESTILSQMGKEKDKLKTVNRSILIEQIDSKTKSFRWFLELYRGLHRHEVENIKECWEFKEANFAPTLLTIQEQEQKIGYPYSITESTLSFCQKEKLITKDNFISYKELCFHSFKEEYEQFLLSQKIATSISNAPTSKTILKI